MTGTRAYRAPARPAFADYARLSRVLLDLDGFDSAGDDDDIHVDADAVVTVRNPLSPEATAGQKRANRLTKRRADPVLTNATLASALVVRWTGVIGGDGVPVPATAANVREVCIRLPEFAAVIIYKTIAQAEDFFGTAPIETEDL